MMTPTNQWLNTDLDPAAIVSAYIASGDATASISNLALLKGLMALSPADRLAWGVCAASCFPAPVAPTDGSPTENTYSVGSIVGITKDAAAFLLEPCTGFAEYVGSWVFDGVSAAVLATTPNTPKIVSITPPNSLNGAPAAAPTTVTVQHGESFIEIVDDDVHALFAKVAALFRSVGAEL